MKPDPKVRRDGKCAQCRGPRNPKRNPYSKDQAFADPFCSARCCREYHGLPTKSPPITTEDPVERIAIHPTVKRREYRAKNRVPCEDCGTPVEGKGRSKARNPNRPYLCQSCYQARRRVAA